jgi:hypothetical protein
MCTWVQLTLPDGEVIHDKAKDCGSKTCPTSSEYDPD